MNLVSNATASIVLYDNDFEEVSRLLSLLIQSEIKKIFIIDNSVNNSSIVLQESIKIEYIHNPSNPGFGAAHNIAIKESIKSGYKYHFIINPDVYFRQDVVTPMIEYMKNDPSIGMMMPQILNLDGTIQNLPKLLPSPWSIILRKLRKPKGIYQKFIDSYELRQIKNKVYNAPVLSGCFTLLNLEAIKQVGMYDTKFFMYFEDWDLSRRMHENYKTLYYPSVSVYHGYASAANKSMKLFYVFIQSAVKYFNKWGWFFDSERDEINKVALSQFE